MATAALLDDLVDGGAETAVPVTSLAGLCCALTGEAAMQIAEAEDPERARAEIVAILRTMLTAAVSGRPPGEETLRRWSGAGQSR